MRDRAPADTRVFLARHAEPEGVDGVHRFLGQNDPPLSPAGRQQAKEMVGRLRDIPLRAVYSSDLRRCLETARPVAEAKDLSTEADPALREIDSGLWQGLSLDEARRLYPAEYAERERDVIRFPFPEGESFVDLGRRAVPVLEQIISSGPGDVLVVGHKGVNRLLVAHFGGLPLEQIFTIPQDYCTITIIYARSTPGGGRRITLEALA